MRSLRRALKHVLSGGLVLVGVLVVGGSAVLADSSSQSTTLNLSVPPSISLTGLATSYSAVAPAGVTTRIDNQMTVNTNDPAGYTLSLAFGSATFVGSPGHSFAASRDMVSKCDSTGTFCGVGTAGGGTFDVFTTTSANPSDQFVIAHSIAVPASQAPDSYSIGLTYTATAN
jgi:hypothetical protein